MYIDLLKSIFLYRGRSRRIASLAMLLGTGLLVGAFYAGAPAAGAEPTREHSGGEGGGATAAVSPSVRVLEKRVARVRAAWSEAGRYYDAQVAPIERVLLRYRGDPELGQRIAVSLVRESNRLGLDSHLLLAVLLVENPWLDPVARSPVGAIGLMQVMPVHRGSFPECGADLEEIETNVCAGATLFARYLRESRGDVDRALLRYNGCVHGTNTPTCRQYPSHVFARAGRASVQAWLGTAPVAGSR